MNLGTGTPQLPCVLERAMRLGRAVGAAFASDIFVSCVVDATA